MILPVRRQPSSPRSAGSATCARRQRLRRTFRLRAVSTFRLRAVSTFRLRAVSTPVTGALRRWGVQRTFKRGGSRLAGGWCAIGVGGAASARAIARRARSAE